VNTGCAVAGRPWNVRLAEVVSGRCVGMDTGSPDNSRKAHTMAQQTTVTLTDDIDGSRAAETVSFGLDGRVYEIDLSKKNAASLRKVLGEFTSSARRVRAGAKSAKATRHSAPSAVDAKAVREWAQAQGISVSARGRVPSDVVEKYYAAIG
jgi:Lsr2